MHSPKMIGARALSFRSLRKFLAAVRQKRWRRLRGFPKSRVYAIFKCEVVFGISPPRLTFPRRIPHTRRDG
jgi:hypothetical protein